jgi:hypothetical protein
VIRLFTDKPGNTGLPGDSRRLAFNDCADLKLSNV